MTMHANRLAALIFAYAVILVQHVAANSSLEKWTKPSPYSTNTLDFSCRKSFSYNDDELGFRPSYSHNVQSQVTHTVRTRPTLVYRPESPVVIEQARQRSLMDRESVPVRWDAIEVQGPDVEDRHTLQELARMTGNAYALPGKKNWYDLDETWNTVCQRALYLRFIK